MSIMEDIIMGRVAPNLPHATGRISLQPREPQTGDKPDINVEEDQQIQSAPALSDKTQFHAGSSILNEISDPEAKTSCPFLEIISADIRFLIFEELFREEEYTIHTKYCYSGHHAETDNKNITAIVQTCRQLRHEALPVFHKGVCVKIWHRASIRSFREHDFDLLDKSQLQHLVIASYASHPIEACLAARQLPKLRSLVIQVSGSVFPELRIPGLRQFADEQATIDFFTRHFLAFCMWQFNREFVLRGMMQENDVLRRCELRFVCTPVLRRYQMHSYGGVVTFYPNKRIVEWDVLGRKMETTYKEDDNSLPCPDFQEPFVWSEEWAEGCIEQDYELT